MPAIPEYGEATQRQRTSNFSDYDIRNSQLTPHDGRFNIISMAVGEGYAPYNRRYMAERQRLGGGKMSTETYGDLVIDVAEETLVDRYQHHATNFLVYGQTETSNIREFVATSRLVKETTRRYTGLPNLESVRLVTPDREDKWKSVIEKDRKYGELSRVVVLKDFRRQGLTTEIVQEMVDGEKGVIDVAMEEGIDYVLMVAQDKFIRHIRQTKLEVVDEIPVALRAAGKRVGKRYPGYWHNQDDPPHLVVTKVPLEQAA